MMWFGLYGNEYLSRNEHKAHLQTAQLIKYEPLANASKCL